MIIITFKLITENDNDVPAIRGGNDIFNQKPSTKIKGVFFEQSIHYRISDSNSRRVTFCLILCVYDYYQLNNAFRSRTQIRDSFVEELSCRPFNYAVACAIVRRFVI